MDKWSSSAEAPTGPGREAPGGSGDEAADGVGGDRRLTRGAELRRTPTRPAPEMSSAYEMKHFPSAPLSLTSCSSSKRLRDPLQNPLQPSQKLIQSSGGWKLHMRHCSVSAVEQDAAGLTQLSSTVEDVFASGDLPRAADTLANMRHCLTAVGEVAEFANIRKQLEVLEDRLDSMVQPRLTDALNNRKVNVAQEMRGILIRIGDLNLWKVTTPKSTSKP
ncbi:UNVERIFIED_CONTAM: Conserved oligomeric Golgi complex subunit [Sesamum latifolium]|uniref:Conserved oligomeric Golgi complex subunit 7 n=1 Tax=Sesamum latifolium TaxID=2727402 RepID=A0AAW2T873_9LAMI